MRTLSLLAMFVLVAFGAAADDPPIKKDAPPAKKKAEPAPKKEESPDEKETRSDSADSPLKEGKDLPGPFHPYNVDVTGKHKGRYHCLVSEHGLDPMVLIFHKNVEFGDALRNLLKALDAAIEKNPNVRLSAFVVFLPDNLPEVVGSDNNNDDLRRELEDKVGKGGGDLKLKHVVLCLDSSKDVEKYGLRDTDLATVILCDKYKVVRAFRLAGSDFNEDAVGQIMAGVAKMGAKRK